MNLENVISSNKEKSVSCKIETMHLLNRDHTYHNFKQMYLHTTISWGQLVKMLMNLNLEILCAYR